MRAHRAAASFSVLGMFMVSAAANAVAQQQAPGRGARAATSAPAAVAEAPARVLRAMQLQAVVYRLSSPAQEVAHLDALELLPRAASPAELEQALGERGQVTVLHRADAPADLNRQTRITQAASAPYIMAAGKDGADVTYGREEAGLELELSGEFIDEGHALVMLEVSLKDFTSGSVSGTSGVHPPVLRRVNFGGPVFAEVDRPLLLINGEAAATTDGGLTYVTWLMLRHRDSEHGAQAPPRPAPPRPR